MTNVRCPSSRVRLAVGVVATVTACHHYGAMVARVVQAALDADGGSRDRRPRGSVTERARQAAGSSRAAAGAAAEL